MNTKADICTAAQESDAPARRRLLIVEDDHDVAHSLGMLLQVLGAEVRIVHDGPSAVAALPTYAPHAILIDIGLPGMDGYEVARRIRELPDYRAITLAALTGWTREEDRDLAHAAGFDRHLAKPVAADALRRLLEELEPRNASHVAQPQQDA